MRGKIRLLLVKVDGDEIEMDRRAALQGQQDIQQRVGVLSTRHAHHDTIALADHAEVLDRLADAPTQVGLQLEEGAR